MTEREGPLAAASTSGDAPPMTRPARRFGLGIQSKLLVMLLAVGLISALASGPSAM